MNRLAEQWIGFHENGCEDIVFTGISGKVEVTKRLDILRLTDKDESLP
ncbi:hypothetical protein [Methanococcoides sp.]|nr:hypothetical protein [Methanococcoides sp.]